MNRHTVTGLANRPTNGRGSESGHRTSGSRCVWGQPFLENIKHVDFSTCVSLLNSLERTPRTRNATGFLLWDFCFQMSCHMLFCSITSLYGHSSAWKPFTKALCSAAHRYLCLYSFLGRFLAPRSNTVQCNTPSKEELFISVPTNSKDLEPLLTFGRWCHIALLEKKNFGS